MQVICHTLKFQLLAAIYCQSLGLSNDCILLLTVSCWILESICCKFLLLSGLQMPVKEILNRQEEIFFGGNVLNDLPLLPREVFRMVKVGPVNNLQWMCPFQVEYLKQARWNQTLQKHHISHCASLASGLTLFALEDTALKHNIHVTHSIWHCLAAKSTSSFTPLIQLKEKLSRKL